MLLEVDVAKKFPDFQCTISFTLNHRRCGIFGASGSGKSTLMQMLSGLLQPDRGMIRLNQRTLFDAETGINLLPETRRIGVVFQHALLFPHLNVQKNLFYGMQRIPEQNRRIEPQQLISALHLDHLLKRRVRHLSGGERQRVALGRAMLSCPHLMLLDEPLSGLDEELKEQIIFHLQQLFERFSMPFLFISHSLWELRMMTDHVLVMGQGRIEQQLTTEKLVRIHLEKHDQNPC